MSARKPARFPQRASRPQGKERLVDTSKAPFFLGPGVFELKRCFAKLKGEI